MKNIPYLFYKQIVMRIPALSSDYLVSGRLDEIIAKEKFDNSLSALLNEVISRALVNYMFI